MKKWIMVACLAFGIAACWPFCRNDNERILGTSWPPTVAIARVYDDGCCSGQYGDDPGVRQKHATWIWDDVDGPNEVWEHYSVDDPTCRIESPRVESNHHLPRRN